MVKPTRNRRPPARLESAQNESPRKSESESVLVKEEETKILITAVESEPRKIRPSKSADEPETEAGNIEQMDVDEQTPTEGQDMEQDPLASEDPAALEQHHEELVLPDQSKSEQASDPDETTAVHEVNIIVDDEVVSQNDEDTAIEDDDQDGRGEEVIHHVEIIEEQHEEEGVEYHIEQDEDEETETSEIILCVDTSAAGQDGEFEVIQPSMFIQKPKPKEIVVNKSGMKMVPKLSKNVGPRMVKLTYGGNLSVDSADDSGNIADESEVGELETRVIQFTTTTVDGQRYTATSVAPTNQMKIIKAQQPMTATRMFTTSGSSGTISGVKRSREALTMDTNYESEPHYEVDDDGVVLVKKSGILQRKRHIENKSTSGTPKSIACYYCAFRSPTVDEMELHLSEEHLSEGDELHRKRMRKRMIRAKEAASSGDQSSDFESSNELNLLDETRESRNPNFECWRCNNRSFAGSGSLRRHINAVHLRLGNHPCQYCGKLFSAKHNLKVHITTVHMRQRNYVCVFCNRTYTENRSLKRHMESTHAGQKYEGNEYVFEAKEKVGRPRTKGQPQNSEFIEGTEIIYEQDGSMTSYEIDEEQITKVEARRLAQEEDLDENDDDEVSIEEHQIVENSDSPTAYPMYIVPNENKTKTQVVIYHDDSISASEEVVVGGGNDVPVAASEEVVITNNVDLPIEDTEGMETFEIKLEVNGHQEDFYAMEAAESGNEQQLVVYETKGSGDDMMMSGSEVVVANEEEVGEHEQVTVHYISADGIAVRGSTYHVNTSYEDGVGSDMTGSGTKRKPYQRIKCGYCGDFFCSRQLFYKHANKVHREQLVEDWHSCPECRRYFPSVEAVKLHCSLIHANENKKTECPYCPTMFTRTCTYYRHANQSHLEIISKSWMLCDGCDLYMPEADKLRQHQVHAHPPRKQKN